MGGSGGNRVAGIWTSRFSLTCDCSSRCCRMVDVPGEAGGEGRCAWARRGEVSETAVEDPSEQAQDLQLHSGQFSTVVSCRSSIATYLPHGKAEPFFTESRSH